jgi:large subunit ribosomal protein L4
MATTKKAPAKKKAAAKKAAPRVKKTPVIEAGKDEAIIYSSAGVASGKLTLPAEVFGAKWNADLVHQVVLSMQANARHNTAHTKFRSEVSGGGKKPWKQKGTGRARHGSNRSPIWVGGGTTHGPRSDRDYSVKINRKMRVAALMSLLSRKLRDGEVIFVENLSFATPKTKEAKAAIVAIAKGTGIAELATKRNNAAIIAFATKDSAAQKSFRNIGSLMTEEVRNLNPVDLATKKYLIITEPEAALKTLASRLTN